MGEDVCLCSKAEELCFYYNVKFGMYSLEAVPNEDIPLTRPPRL